VTQDSRAGASFRHMARAPDADLVAVPRNFIDEVTVRDPEGFEVAFRWRAVFGTPTMRFEVSDENLPALGTLVDVLGAVARHPHPDLSPQELCDILAGLGIRDATADDARNGRDAHDAGRGFAPEI